MAAHIWVESRREDAKQAITEAAEVNRVEVDALQLFQL